MLWCLYNRPVRYKIGLVSESDFTRTTPTDNCPTCPSESIFEESDNSDICRTFVRVSDLSDRPRIVGQIGGQHSIRGGLPWRQVNFQKLKLKIKFEPFLDEQDPFDHLNS